MEETYYEILNIYSDATQAEIKFAFHQKMKIFHPDVFKGNKSDAENICSKLNQAYSTLSNPIKRNKYDNILKKYNIYYKLINKNKKNNINNSKKNKKIINKLKLNTEKINKNIKASNINDKTEKKSKNKIKSKNTIIKAKELQYLNRIIFILSLIVCVLLILLIII